MREGDIITLFRFDQPKATHDQNAFIIVDRSYYCRFLHAVNTCTYTQNKKNEREKKSKRLRLISMNVMCILAK